MEGCRSREVEPDEGREFVHPGMAAGERSAMRDWPPLLRTDGLTNSTGSSLMTVLHQMMTTQGRQLSRKAVRLIEPHVREDSDGYVALILSCAKLIRSLHAFDLPPFVRRVVPIHEPNLLRSLPCSTKPVRMLAMYIYI